MAEHPWGAADGAVPRPRRDESWWERARRWSDLDVVRWSAVAFVAVAIGLGVWWHQPAVVPEDVLPRTSTTSAVPDPGDGADGGAPPDASGPDPSAAEVSAAEARAVDASAGGPNAPSGGSSLPSGDGEVVTVHVVGAVADPGLVTLGVGERIADAIEQVGGPTDIADVHQLNLATVLVDGMRVVVPERGKPPVGGSDVGESLVELPPADGHRGEAVVNINEAGPDELETLRGVGPATAAAIVEHRREHGRFDTVDALLDVTGIGPAKLDGMRDRVTTGR